LLKAQGVNLTVAVTHMTKEEDCTLSSSVEGIDFIVGGHEHQTTMTTDCGDAPYFKATSDVRTVWQLAVDLNEEPTGVDFINYKHYEIHSGLPEDPVVKAVADKWIETQKRDFGAVLGSTQVALTASTVLVRAQETNLGNWIADACKYVTGADIGMVNGGGIRGNRVFPPGQLTRETLTSWHPFGNVIVSVQATGAQLKRMLEYGASNLPNGGFLQISGIKWVYNYVAATRAATAVEVLKPDGTAVADTEVLTVAVNSYQAAVWQKNLFASSPLPYVITDAIGQNDFLVLEQYLKTFPDHVINPQIEGRITQITL